MSHFILLINILTALSKSNFLPYTYKLMAKPYLEEGCADTCIHFEDYFLGPLILGLLEAEKLDQLDGRLEGCQLLFDFRVVLGQIKS